MQRHGVSDANTPFFVILKIEQKMITKCFLHFLDTLFLLKMKSKFQSQVHLSKDFFIRFLQIFLFLLVIFTVFSNRKKTVS